MRFKLDENVPRRAAQLLSDRGHDVSTVYGEELVGATDEVVAGAAKTQSRVLISLDKDLGDLRSFPPGTHPGIIVLRLSDQSASRVADVLRKLTSTFDVERLAQCLTVVVSLKRALDPLDLIAQLRQLPRVIARTCGESFIDLQLFRLE